MSESEIEPEDIERKVHDLASSMKKVKSAQADRDDVVVEMKHATATRLDLLAEDLIPVFSALPEDADMFDFGLVKGDVPRLWVDMTSFVRMGKNGRVYEFVKDTRMGRTILASSKNREKIGERVTDYVAERLLDRERIMEGDWISARKYSSEKTDNDLVEEDVQLVDEDDVAIAEAKYAEESTVDKSDLAEDNIVETTEATDAEVIENASAEIAPKSRKGLSYLSSFVWFLIGLAIGIGILMFALVFDEFEPLRQWIAGATAQT